MSLSLSYWNITGWVSDWVHNFFSWGSSAMEAANETKFGTKVA